MSPSDRSRDDLIERIRRLNPDQLAQVDSLVSELESPSESARLRRAWMRLSEPAFRRVWDNPEDDVYDRL